jgi:hypothetical protein
MCSVQLVFFLFLSSTFPAAGLRLDRLTVPEWVEHGGSAHLTCEFSFAADELPQLDVKWYHALSPAPFLVWIPATGAEPRVLLVPPVATHVVPLAAPPAAGNATSSVGERRLASRLRLERVAVSLSGDYTCTVSTFTQELSLTQHIQVYGEYWLYIGKYSTREFYTCIFT